MQKTISFNLELTFESKINDDNDILQVAQNVANAIVNETNGNGIAPQDGDTYLEIVRITPKYINKTIIEHVN